MVILLILLQVADTYSTLLILKKGGRELNPFLDYLFKKFDPLSAMLIVKSVMVAIVWYANSEWLTLIGCLAYAAVVLNNVMVLKGMK